MGKTWSLYSLFVYYVANFVFGIVFPVFAQLQTQSQPRDNFALASPHFA
jgi:hypothetical protein